jgi:hypothetical protein
LASSSTKKVVVRRFDREPLSGFVSLLTYQQPAGVELLKQDGQISLVSYGEIKLLCFVKEFENVREPLDGGVFQTRPKMEGLWVRMKFRDGEVLDGVLPNNLLQLEPRGYTLTPPEPYANHQRIFVPREALDSIQVLGVVGSPLRKRISKRVTPDTKVQPGLFE